MGLFGNKKVKQDIKSGDNNVFDDLSKKELKNIDVIKFEGDNKDLFWRICVDVVNPNCEIVVPETHYCNLRKDGVTIETLSGCRKPIFEPGDKKKTATVDALFMSKTARLRVLWGTQKQFDLRDPLTDIPIKVGAYGEFETQISNPREFANVVVGADRNFNIDNLKERLLMRMLSEVEPAISKAMRNEHLSYDRLSEYKKEISQAVLKEVREMFLNDYGLQVFSFTIAGVNIAEEYIHAIEDELRRVKDKKELEIEREIEKREAKELADYLERLDDKEFDRSLILKKLEMEDREKYYEVIKTIESNKATSKPKSANFCPHCGEAYSVGAKFCTNCGQQVGNVKKICPECGAEVSSEQKFCMSCGCKLK